MKILLICAHADDETIGMGGTLKKLSKENEIEILFLTDGVLGRRSSGFVNSNQYEISDEKMKEIEKDVETRKNHAKNALKILGIKKFEFLDLPNVELDQIPLLKIIKEIERKIHETKCDTIFTHHYNDLNIDHRLSYEATITAARPIPNSPIKSIFSFEIPASTDWRHPYNFRPNLFVDVTKEWKSKISALKKYQYEIREPPHPRSEDQMQTNMKRWGGLSGYHYAEAFEIISMRRDNISKNFNS